MENTIQENEGDTQAKVEATGNPYANGKGRAIVERLLRENREYWENYRKHFAEQQRVVKKKEI